jgi:hypothetical protein
MSAHGITPPNPGSAASESLLNETAASRRGPVRLSCAGCDATWTALGAAHCSGCHITWSGVTLFDRHRSVFGERGTCTPPEQLRTADGQPICEYRDGMWRFPEMDEATKTARFGRQP